MIRAFILFVLLLLAACEKKPPTSEFQPMPKNVACPTNDIGGWWHEPNALVAQKVRYSVKSREDFAAICGPKAIACAFVGLQDGVPVGVISTMQPIETFSPVVKQHELCHLLGWRHGPWLL